MKPDDEPELTERQALITEVLLGIKDRSDPAVVAASADPSFVAMLEALQAVQQRLDRGAVAERQAAHESRLPRDAGLADQVHKRLRRWQRWPLGLALCAAALAVAVVLLFQKKAPSAPAYETLEGGVKIVCEPDFVSMSWDAAPGATRYRVLVLTPGSDGKLTEADSVTLATNRWQPSRHRDYGPWVRIEVFLPGIEGDRRIGQGEFWRSGQRR